MTSLEELSASELFNKGNYRLAARAYIKKIKKNYNNNEIVNLTSVLIKLNKNKIALTLLEKILKKNPMCSLAHMNKGLVLKKLNSYDESLMCMQMAIKLEEARPEYFNNIGNLLIEMGQYQRAMSLLCIAIVLKQNFTDAIYNLANANLKAGELKAAEILYKNVNEILPKHYGAQTNLAFIYYYTGEIDKSTKYFSNALKIEPFRAESHCNMGVVYKAKKQYRLALDSFKRSISINSEYYEAYVNIAMILLADGKYNLGFKFYKYGWLTGLRGDKKKYLSAGRWFKGSNAKSILIWAEQGIGDELMLLKLLRPFVKKYVLVNINIFVEVDARLIEICKASFGEEFIFIPRNARNDVSYYDSHIPIGDLLELIITDEDNLYVELSSNHYIEVDKLSYDREEFSKVFCKRINVGISWKTLNKRGYSRNINPGEIIRRHNSSLEIDYFNLQYGLDSAEIIESEKIGIKSFANIDLKEDMTKIAVAISALDCVITIDNYIAHLAGSMGKLTYLLLPYESEWRWGKEESKCMWYENTTIIRQTEINDWSSVVDRLMEMLNEKYEFNNRLH